MQKLIAVWGFLKGKKTFILSACIFLLGGCKALGLVDDHVFMSLYAMLTGSGIAALRASK